jgi:hypothetical protein
MKKAELNEIAIKYGVNPLALKQTLKTDGIDRKTVTLKEVLECIYIHCSELMYCRQSDYEGVVEYLDTITAQMLINDMSKANREAVQ